jgi:hypothetical protein
MTVMLDQLGQATAICYPDRHMIDRKPPARPASYDKKVGRFKAEGPLEAIRPAYMRRYRLPNTCPIG